MELGSLAEELQLSSDSMCLLTGLGRRAGDVKLDSEDIDLDEMMPNAKKYAPGDYKTILV